MSKEHTGPRQDPAHAPHRRHDAEAQRLERAAEFFKQSGDEKMLSQIMPQLQGAKDRLGHAQQAAEFVSKLGLSHDVKTEGYTENDAIGMVSKLMHEHEQHESGDYVIKSTYARAHAHVKHANDGAHVDAEKLEAPRDTHAELVEALGLTDPAHIEAARGLFVKGSK